MAEKEKEKVDEKRGRIVWVKILSENPSEAGRDMVFRGADIYIWAGLFFFFLFLFFSFLFFWDANDMLRRDRKRKKAKKEFCIDWKTPTMDIYNPH